MLFPTVSLTEINVPVEQMLVLHKPGKVVCHVGGYPVPAVTLFANGWTVYNGK